MKCTKSMLFAGGIIVAALGTAYLGLPSLRNSIAELGPSLILLLCPLSMILMMGGMRSEAKQQDALIEPQARDQAPDIAGRK